jgi:hypothetical protein
MTGISWMMTISVKSCEGVGGEHNWFASLCQDVTVTYRQRSAEVTQGARGRIEWWWSATATLGAVAFARAVQCCGPVRRPFAATLESQPIA